MPLIAVEGGDADDMGSTAGPSATSSSVAAVGLIASAAQTENVMVIADPMLPFELPNLYGQDLLGDTVDQCRSTSRPS